MTKTEIETELKSEKKRVDTMIQILVFIDSYKEFMELRAELDKVNDNYKNDNTLYSKDEIETYRATQRNKIKTMLNVLDSGLNAICGAFDFETIKSTTIILNSITPQNYDMLGVVSKLKSSQDCLKALERFIEEHNIIIPQKFYGGDENGR